MGLPSDHELMGRVREGDERAFELLLARHETKVRRRLVGMVKDQDAADDLLQEVFLRVWQRAHRWDGRGALPAWLLRIATNLALNYLRSVRRRREQPLRAAAPDMGDEEMEIPSYLIDASALGPDAVAEQAERYRLVRRLIEDLPEEKREVIRLIQDEEMEMREAAETLGIPEGTVKSRLHNAKKRLAQQWKELENGEEE